MREGTNALKRSEIQLDNVLGKEIVYDNYAYHVDAKLCGMQFGEMAEQTFTRIKSHSAKSGLTEPYRKIKNGLIALRIG